MIAKINNGASIFGAVEYNMEKVNDDMAKVILQRNMIENYSGDSSLDRYFALRTFEPYLQINRNTEKPAVHISLNPAPEDCLSDEQMSNIAHGYMEKPGFGNQPFIIYKHEYITSSRKSICSSSSNMTKTKSICGIFR